MPRKSTRLTFWFRLERDGQPIDTRGVTVTNPDPQFDAQATAAEWLREQVAEELRTGNSRLGPIACGKLRKGFELVLTAEPADVRETRHLMRELVIEARRVMAGIR